MKKVDNPVSFYLISILIVVAVFGILFLAFYFSGQLKPKSSVQEFTKTEEVETVWRGEVVNRALVSNTGWQKISVRGAIGNMLRADVLVPPQYSSKDIQEVNNIQKGDKIYFILLGIKSLGGPIAKNTCSTAVYVPKELAESMIKSKKWRLANS